MTAIWNQLLLWLFPPKCAACKAVLKNDRTFPLCHDCLILLNNARRLSSCRLDSAHVKLCYCLYKYRNETVRHLVYEIKFKGEESLFRFLAHELYCVAQLKGLLTLADTVTYTPRRKTEKRRAGFDQADLLAQALAEKTGLAFDRLLFRTGSSKKQRALTAAGRRENVKGKFFVKQDLTGKSVILVDDVVTTGATVCECAKMLTEAGAKAVFILAVAK